MPPRSCLGVLAVLALALLAAPAPASEEAGVRPEACAGQRFIAQRIACFSEQAVREGDPAVCMRAAAPDERWPCIAKYAVVAGDAATCGLLPGPEAEDAGELDQVSVDLCLTTLALVYRKPALCRTVRTPAMDESCLAKLVSLGGDPRLCGEIRSPELRAVCRPESVSETGR